MQGDAGEILEVLLLEEGVDEDVHLAAQLLHGRHLLLLLLLERHYLPLRLLALARVRLGVRRRVGRPAFAGKGAGSARRLRVRDRVRG